MFKFDLTGEEGGGVCIQGIKDIPVLLLDMFVYTIMLNTVFSNHTLLLQHTSFNEKLFFKGMYINVIVSSDYQSIISGSSHSQRTP